jgi:Mg2+/Co2+ transporter CorB
MLPTNRDARAVGAWYFALATARFSLIYVPNTLVVPNAAAATASRILGHEMMFRLSILNEVFVAIVFVVLSLAAYRLLRRPASSGSRCGC